jgi:hypothetical protein
MAAGNAICIVRAGAPLDMGRLAAAGCVVNSSPTCKPVRPRGARAARHQTPP